MQRLRSNIIVPLLSAMIMGCTTGDTEEKVILSDVSQADFCAANNSWISDPSNPPAEIPGGGKNLCQFYQFSWQWFIHLMDANNGSQRVYQNAGDYPVYLGGKNDSCTNNTLDSLLFVRSQKDKLSGGDDFILPSGMNQALNDAVIYDQQGNIVLYEARFDENMCKVAQGSKTLPPGTTEIKSSWRKITESEKNDYVWIQSDTNNNGKLEDTELYGMVGFHLVKSTPLHPEFIWATFEHRLNAPDCQKPPISDQSSNWSFTSESCANDLPDATQSGCDFNKTLDPKKGDSSPLTGQPTEICRVYAQATRSGDNQAETNRANIISINAQLKPMFAALAGDNALQVLQNYKIVGALWEDDIKQPSSVIANQRGSIQLANTTMETNAQQGFSEKIYTNPQDTTPAANCFACHSYTGADSNAGISHIFKYIHGQSSTK